MKYFGGFGLFELYNLPIKIRNFYFSKLSKQLELEKEAIEKANRKR